jgi:hypothetical protein
MVAQWGDVVAEKGDMVAQWGDVVAPLVYVLAEWVDRLNFFCRLAYKILFYE